MYKNNKIKAANLISRIFDPSIIILILLILIIFRSKLSLTELLKLIFFLPVIIGIPLGYILWKLKTKEINNWEITNRKQRIKPFLVFLISLIIDIALISQLNNQYLLNFIYFFFIWLSGFLIITLFWKISGHSSINTIFALLIINWYGINFLPVFFIIPFVSWARFVKRVHTPEQIIAGIAYSSFMVYVGVKLLAI